MKTIFLMVVILGLALGCATGPPIKNPQFTESNLPKQCRIDSIRPIEAQEGVIGGGIPYVDMVLNFYGRPLGKETKDKAIARVRAKNIMGGVFSLGLGPEAAVSGALSTADGIKSSTSPASYYPTALGLHGFKSYSFYDQSPDGTKIKYFLAQGHPVIARPGLLTGYDDEKEIFFVCDPKLGEAIEIPYKDFPRRQAFEWADTSKLVRKGEIIYPKK